MSESGEDSSSGLKTARVLTRTIDLLTETRGVLPLAVVTIYAPYLAIAYFWPAPNIWSAEFLVWSLQISAPLLVSVVFYAWIALRYMEPDNPSPIAVVFQRIAPIILTQLIVNVGAVVLAWPLLIPSILWGLACTVAIPVAIVERSHPFKSLGRSYSLTRNRLGSIFLIALFVYIPVGIAVLVLEQTLTGWQSIQAPDQSPYVVLGVRPVLNTFYTAFAAAYAAAVYGELLVLPPRRVPESEVTN